MKKCVVSVSGGKDSTALYLWAIEQFGVDGFKAVMADTGHEHPITIDYAKKLHLVSGGPKVEIVKADFSDRLKKQNKPVSGSPMKDLCAVCLKESAVLDVKPHEPSVLLPCWLCQGKGWQLKRKNKWFREVLDWIFGV